MCGTSQRQYELGQKQGKTLVISRLPSGGTGARRREETNAEKKQSRAQAHWPHSLGNSAVMGDTPIPPQGG
jgi:hypothetical protein